MHSSEVSLHRPAARAALVAGMVLCLAAPAFAQSVPRVRVDTGMLSGTSDGGVEAFLGIPYAAPPVGDLRWRAPQPASPWHGARDAGHYGHDCMQDAFPNAAAPLTTTPAEDCLFANVWRPANAKGKLPVMVWIHGGGNVNGGTSPAVYAGASFARDGVVFVSFNYRLGRFGFFGFPELGRRDEDHGLRGNYGFMDAMAALAWVQRNVASFGGDPARVTIAGQSAGAGQVAMLLCTPRAHGLFAQAIMQSMGAATNNLPSWEGDNATGIEQAGLNFARRWHIDGTGAEALARLRALSPEQVADGLNIATLPDQRERFSGPVRDGTLMTEPLVKALDGGRAAKVPLLIGSTTADNYGAMKARSVEEAYAGAFARDMAQARAAYGGLAMGDYTLREMGRDIGYREPVRHISAMMRAQGMPVFDYRFGYVADVMHQEWPEGPPHATDIPYAMDTLQAKYASTLTLQDAEVARKMHGYWVNFVKTGNPNGPELAVWPTYSAREDFVMRFQTDGSATAAADPLKARLDAVAGAR